MNDTKQTSPCTCTTCPGASCTCGCQTFPTQVAAQAATQAACACGPQCQCGQGCTCPKS
jgi:hypothetical protein